MQHCIKLIIHIISQTNNSCLKMQNPKFFKGKTLIYLSLHIFIPSVQPVKLGKTNNNPKNNKNSHNENTP